MEILSLFLVLLVHLSLSDSKKFVSGPQIKVEDGHLVITTYGKKNINFKTSSAAAVTINDVDVLPIIQRANRATQFITFYQNSLTSFTNRLSVLEQRISDPGLFNVTNTDTSVRPQVNRRLNRKITVLQRRVDELEYLLTKDECASNPCKNGGVCQDLYNDYICHCTTGWEGHDCSKDTDECVKFSGTDLGCQNGATCVNKKGSYECLCPTGYYGLHCTRTTADCATGGTELCGHGTCIPQNTGVGYKCLCDQGWTTDTNGRCTADIDECNLNHPQCSTNPRVSCINVPGSFFCGPCPQGYTGNGYYCADINECELFNGHCSMNPMVSCINTPGSRICGSCPPGYYGDGTTCSFQGVCNVNNGGCHHIAQCRDNPRISSTYVECICPVGYVGNGIGPNGCVLSPSQLNPCASNPCVNGVCSVNNATGDYVCNCRRRYTGRNCAIIKDPCLSNPCLNGGTCNDVSGITFKCVCPTGFFGARCDTQAQGCGGKLLDKNGTLRYPAANHETYDNLASCSWTIEVNNTKVINITFTKFDIEKSDGCRFDWLQIHDGPNSAAHSLGRFCGNAFPLGGKIQSTHNIIYFWFRSDRRTTKGGFELTWNATDPVCGRFINATSHGSIESPGSPGVYPPNRDCYWALLAPDRKRLLFHFYSLNIGENSDCNSDYLEFSSGLNARNNDVFAKFCNTSKPSPFHSIGRRTVVHFHSDAQGSNPGFQLTYSVVEGIPGCGGTYTTQSGTIASAHPPEDVFADDVKHICDYKIQQPIGTKLKITITAIDLVQTPGCKIDYLEIREGPNTDSPLINRFCGNVVPPPYMSYSNQLTIVSSTSKNSDQWKLNYQTVCGERFTESTGKFSSPQGNVRECIYQIQRPAGYRIELVLKFSAMATHYSCMFGSIEVRDGDSENSTLIGKYCQNSSEIITSTHNFLWIRFSQFYTRRWSTYSFEASYTSIDTGCGGILRDNLGTIASPTHPDGYYPPRLRCSWLIIAPPQNVIQLTWITFNLEQSHECRYDSVEVYDNNTALGTGDLMGKFCGFTLPRPLLTLSNTMTIVFTTDITIHMDGFRAAYVFIPESNVCGGNYFTSAGVIKSPKYPDEYPVNQECIWTITVQPSEQILLNVTDFDIEYFPSCRYDWLEIRNGGTSASPLIDRYCGTNIPKLIPSHTNQLYLFFKSDVSRSDHGFRITWSSTSTGCGGTLSSPSGSIISPHYPEPYSRNSECTWKITISAGSRMQLVFSDIDLERHGQCLADYVEIFDGLTSNSKSLGKFCTEGGSPIISTGNQVMVKFRSDVAFQGRGFQLHYNTICHNTLTGFRGIIESPNFPNGYPHNQDCLWDIIVSSRNKINITFSHFELERSLKYGNGSCLFDYVEVKYSESKSVDWEDTDVSFVTQGKYCGTNNPGLITVDSDHAKVHFVSDKLVLGSGFRLEWQLFGCGGILTHNTGTIMSPNYPKMYPPSVRCEWLIEVDYGSSIQLRFNDVSVEASSSCESYDSVTVYNGGDNSSNVLAVICRQKTPTILTSTGNLMFVVFVADYSHQGRGFIANYTTVPSKCGGHFTAVEGKIFSPNYPKNYDKNDTCEWLIEVDETHSIDLEFKDLDLLQTDNCSSGYVKIYDGPTAAYPVLETLCGSITPNKTIHSTFNEMYIEFKASKAVTTKGFEAAYRKSCGSRFTTQGSGIIELDQSEFSDNMPSCTWTIVSTDPSRHISLIITHIYGHSYYCDESFSPIRIYGGESTSSPLLKSICTEEVPPPIVSEGSAITIYTDQEVGFSATYSVFDSHCGGTYTAMKGYFATPGYPNKYPSAVQCEWLIKVSAGNHISLNFLNFELVESDDCNTDYLEIRKNNASGKLLGTYCGKNKPANITQEGSLWMIFKTSTPDKDTPIIAKGFYGMYSFNMVNELSGPHGIIQSPQYPKLYSQDTVTWKITVSSRKKILLTFKEWFMETQPMADEEECFYSFLSVYDGDDSTATNLASYCSTDTPDPVQSTSNVLYIELENNVYWFGMRFVLEWLEISNTYTGKNTTSLTVKDCGSSEVININTLRNYTIVTSPGYPGGYKPNLNCEWIFSTIPMNHLQLYFVDIDLQDDRCFADYITVYQKHYYDNDWQHVKTLCSRKDSNSIIPAMDLLKLKFVSNRLFNGTGFKASITAVCGGSMMGPSGYIIFDDTSHKNSLNIQECQWNITARSGRTIKLSFEQMNMSKTQDGSCNNYIMLRNGKFSDSPILGVGKYCGTELPQPLESTGNYLYIKYKGSPFNNFRLKYQEVSFACGGEFTLSPFDTSIQISSPNYPNIPPPYTECMWVIRAPPDRSLRLDFLERFDLTITKDCNTEYVELRDGGTEYSPLIGRYCKNAPSTQLSTGNIMFVKFFTDTDEPKNGFKAEVDLAYCGGTVRGSEGEIRSPSHLGQNKINCTWHIEGPVGHYLTLEFTKIEVKKVFGCAPSNMVTVSESFLNATVADPVAKTILSPEDNKLGQFCGLTPPPPFSTSTNKATVQFRGDSTDKFILKFNASMTACGGTLTQEFGEIQSPGYPLFSQRSRMCLWIIKVPQGRRVTLKILDLAIDTDQNRQVAILAICDGPKYRNPSYYPKPANLNAVYESSSNLMAVGFWSSSLDHRRFKTSFTSENPTICVGDFNGQQGLITQPSVRNSSYWCLWTHSNMSTSQTFSLTITYNTNATRVVHNCKHGNAWIIQVMDPQDRILATLCGISEQNRIVRSPFLGTKLEASVKKPFSMNFTVSYKVHDCGGIINGEQGFISTPNFPNKPTKSVECVWLLKVDKEQVINLTSVNEDLGSDCEKNYLSVYNGDLPSHPRIGKFCKDNKFYAFISQRNSLWIEYKWETGSSGTGVKLKYEAIEQGCGGIFHDKSRIIQSANYGKDYPNNAECLWEIRSDPGYSIRLEFIDRFHIETSQDCKNDYLEIFDWKFDVWVSLGKKCGRNTPDAIQSTGDKLKLLFRTNNEVTGTGFKAKWDWRCGGTFEASSTPRYIVSPGYPLHYSSNLVCIYNITSKKDVVNIRFEDFELERGSSNCAFDNVTVKVQYGSYSLSNQVFCGTNKPPLVRVRGKTLITFKTDDFIHKKGFKFMFKDEQCGGEITEEQSIEFQAVKTDMGTYRYYQPWLKCSWKIVAPDNKIPILTVSLLDMPEAPNCFIQNLQVYNGPDEIRNRRLVALCGYIKDGQPIAADSGKMLVKLNGSPVTYNGFKAQVTFTYGSAQGCGGVIRLNKTKIIQSPNLKDLDCHWTIIADTDYQIQIHFTELNIPASCTKMTNATFTFCTCSFIEIRDGASANSDLIMRLCSRENSATNRNFTTSSNVAFIRFFLMGVKNNVFKATLTPVLSKCGPTVLNATGTIQTLTSPNYPNTYPSGIKCSWVFTSSSPNNPISLHFVDFDLTEENLDVISNTCNGDKIEIADDPDRKIISEGLGQNAVYRGNRKSILMNYNDLLDKHVFCGKGDHPFDYYSIRGSLTVLFDSSNSIADKGKGFKLEYSIAGCNRNYTALQGRIYNGRNRTSCIITITVPDNYTISLYFLSMFIPYSTNCSNYIFEVRDASPTGKELLKTCEFRAPNPVFSYTNKVYIQIKSPVISNSIFYPRYDLIYTSTKDGRGCGGDLYNYKGRFTSPLYPDQYRSTQVCTWNIRVPTELHAVLKFTIFDVQGNCADNYVKVITYSNNLEDSHTFCKDDNPGVLRSNSRIKVEYSSSAQNGGTGWIALFQGVAVDAPNPI